ncbi:MAG TPA: Gfo/Idh/MocA family oxidoreductase [Gammaproteobacteria bacterium]|nr:Gfo/Idh/MocA family oxidoreductase [Gammaproteobacteria bacterium]
MRELRLGLVGAGHWGQCYIKTLDKLPAAHLAALASSNPRSQGLINANCQLVEDWRALADIKPALDGVIIATPTPQHFPIAQFMLEANLPVLVEKPMTTSVDEARKLHTAASVSGQLLMVGHTHLYSAAYEMLRSRASKLGRLVSIDAQAGGPGPYRPDTSPLWDWGVHDLALCLDLTEAIPSEVLAERLESANTSAGYSETIAITLRFPQGEQASIKVSNMMVDKCRRFTAEFERGRLTYNDFAKDKLLLETAPGKTRPVQLDDGLPLTRQLLTFCSSIIEKRHNDPGLSLGVAVIETLARCEEKLAQTSAKGLSGT